MKNIWLAQVPFIVLCTLAFYITEIGIDGTIENRTLRERVRPGLLQISTLFTDIKFHLRGRQKQKNPNIVVVLIDNDAINEKGRWPWHRDTTAKLIKGVFDAGAKVVGLDIVFSEPDTRISPELGNLLDAVHLGSIKQNYETDPQLIPVIREHADQLVMGWAPEGECQPLYDRPDDCPVIEHYHDIQYPENFDKYSVTSQTPKDASFTKTPMISVVNAIVNIPEFGAVAKHSGFFMATPDPDGAIRRSPLVLLMNGRAYPSLPLEMARIVLKDDINVEFTDSERIKKINFVKSGRELPATPVGVVEFNARGWSNSPIQIPAMEIFNHQSPSSTEGDVQRKLASDSESEKLYDKLKDAIVFIGLSATGAFDMRSFTFDKNLPGVLGHATLLDNILANDIMRRGSDWADPRWIYLLMIVGGLLFAYYTQKLEAIPALLFTITVFSGIGFFDVKVLFSDHNIDWHTSFLFIEYFLIFVFTVAVKYVLEEKNKKFVRAAFSKYVAPAVVDAIMKNPEKLTVGGERRDLTIMFSDIRSFTTFSERLDAKSLAAFLNEYLSIMTEIIFANQGTLDKYIGDAIMAFWGAPLDQSKHAYYACQAAHQMMQALAKNKERWKKTYDVDVDIGVGVNSGLVSVGNMGSSNNFAYTVIGDHVNLASRLEGLTKYYEAGIMTTRFTFDSIAASGEQPLPHRTLDWVKVKGKQNGVELIQILERPMPEDALKLFEEARSLYVRQKWDEAIELFTKVLTLIPEDGPTKLFIERCKRFKVFSPGADWDGVWEMRSK